ncbi:MAG: hypothetical protein A2W08_03080 [Candidatus Rokubacteria bacterium RBG_16_73_20]|nr:MAG: hypothetical protein A2050_10325 [Candidatus Rokubacteria bacterium GWA2_73_35]OGK95074.1 MAG: hypothetical protein A2W08_03080 [Candidatus Rokubacteria bacterium RBG_16_73_20]HBH01445.1 hypothetical protein [Candidatus Rokubacteria bacterium]
MGRVIRRALAVALVLASWAGAFASGAAAAGPADASRDITLRWDGTAWVEVPPGHPATRMNAGGKDRVGSAASSDRAGQGAEASPAGPRAAGVAPLVGGDVERARRAGTPPATPAATAAERSTRASLSLVGLLHNGLSRTGREFKLARLRDLQIVVDWANLPGAANVQRIEVLGPDGKLYQTFTTPIASVRTETRLPVGGTWITQHNLVGAWRVKVYLNRDSSPVTTRAFRLSR